MESLILSRETFFDQIKNIETLYSKGQIYSFFFSSGGLTVGKANFFESIKKKSSFLFSPFKKKDFFFFQKQNIFQKNFPGLFYSDIEIKKIFDSFQFVIKGENGFSYKSSKIIGKNLTWGFFKTGLFHSNQKFRGFKPYNFKNKIEFYSGSEGILVEIFKIFPYLFCKKLIILKGLKMVPIIDLNPLIFTTFSKNKLLTFWFLLENSFKQIDRLEKIGNIRNTRPAFFSWNRNLCPKTLFFAVASSIEIKTFRFLFTRSSNAPSLEICGTVTDTNKTPLNGMVWGGGQTPFLFTSSFDGGISLWNELLFPLFNIYKPNQSCLFFKGSLVFPLFMIGLRKKSKNKKNLRIQKSFKYSPETIVEMVSLKKISEKKKKIIWEKIKIYLKINENITKKEILNFLKRKKNHSRKKNSSQLNQFILSICEKTDNNKIKGFNLHSIYILLLDYISNFLSLKVNFTSFNRKANCLFLNLIGNIRSITVIELEFYQFNQKNEKKELFFQTCFLCRRLQRIKIESGKVCPFFHKIHSHFNKEYFKCEQLFSNLETGGDKKNLSDFIFPTIYPRKFKNSYSLKKVFFQKEFNWKTT